MKPEHLACILWGLSAGMLLTVGSDRFVWLLVAWCVMAAVMTVWIIRIMRQLRK